MATQLQEKRQDLNQQIKKAEKDHQDKLQQKIREIFQTAFDQVASFAEDYWEKNEQQMQSGWKEKLERLSFATRLEAEVRNASQNFQHEVKEAIEEIGNELKIINQLQDVTFNFSQQDSSFFDKDFVRRMGMLMVAAGTVLTFIFPPLGMVMSIAGGVVSWLAGQFKSRDQKRCEAVDNISKSLRQQLNEQQRKVIKEARKILESYCKAVGSAVDDYFEELIQGIEAIANQLKSAEGKLANAANDLNRAYAKRIIDWTTDQPETLTDTAISSKICKVNRVFGSSLDIQTTTALSLTKSQEEICTVLQECVSIQHTKN